MISITIFTDDACFEGRAEREIASILRKLANTFTREGMLEPGVQYPIISVDGNRVGECECIS